MKKQILLLIAMFAIPTILSAQSKLASLEFETPDCLIKPKGDNCNVRQNPNPKSKKVSTLYNVTGAKDHNAQWYKISEGYVSKSATQKVKQTPITSRMLLPNCYFDEIDMDECQTWGLCDDVGSHHLALYYSYGNYVGNLYLGKRIGDIVMLKYFVWLSIEKDESSPKTIKLKRESQDGRIYMTLTLGTGFFSKGDKMKHEDGNVIGVNFKLLNDGILEKIFGEEIDKGPNTNKCLTGDDFPEELRNLVKM